MELGPKQNILINELISLFSSIGVFKKFRWGYDNEINKIRLYALPLCLYTDMVKGVGRDEIDNFAYSCIMPDEEQLSDMAMMKSKYYDILSSLLNAYISGSGNRSEYKKDKPIPPPSIAIKDGKIIEPEKPTKIKIPKVKKPKES